MNALFQSIPPLSNVLLLVCLLLFSMLFGILRVSLFSGAPPALRWARAGPVQNATDEGQVRGAAAGRGLGGLTGDVSTVPGPESGRPGRQATCIRS